MFRIQLKKLREQKNYKSQKAFADAIGVSQSTVGNWESGTREPNLQLILKIANTLDVSVDELLGNTQTNAPKLNLLSEPSGYWDGSRLHEERIARGYSIAQISSLLDMDQVQYVSLESSTEEPSFELLLHLADVFGFDLDYLCHRMMKIDSTTPLFFGSENLLIKKYRALDKNSQTTVWAVLNSLYDSQSGEEAVSSPRQA